VYAHLCLVLRSGLSSRRSVDVNGGERCCGEFPSALDHIVGAGGCPVIFWVLRSENRWTRFLWMESMSLLRVRTVFVSSFDNLPCVEPKKNIRWITLCTEAQAWFIATTTTSGKGDAEGDSS
jgi:hypothetical protein